MNTKRIYSGIVLFLAASLTAGASFAGSASAPMTVSATVAASCTVSANPLNFGAYDQIGANAAFANSLDATSTVDVTCTNGTAATVELNYGVNSVQASGTTRAMSDGGSNYLNYELYQDSGYTTVWGMNSDTLGQNYTGTGSQTSLTVYGRIPGNQKPAVANYSDTVDVFVNF